VRPFRFAVTATRAASPDEWREKARRAESLGFSAFLMPDHLGRQFAPLPALTAAAAATTRLRIASFVFANDYRNPVMLAKEAATLDVLSGGRLDFGLGAGWSTRDYEQLGIVYDPPGTRVSRMIEATRLIKRLFAEESVDFAGDHYKVRRAKLWPRPAQRPRPPVMVGGGGPRVISFAAREAEIVAFIPQFRANGSPRLEQLTDAATARKVEIVRAAAAERFDQLDLNVIVFDAQISNDRQSVAAEIAMRMKAAVNAIFHSPYFLFGSVEEIRAELLERRRRLGINYYAIPDRAMESFAPVVAELATAP
jgi:probable F420-dependent oxidoreductase